MLIRCPDCKVYVHPDNENCPYCESSLKEKSNLLPAIIFIICSIAALVIYFKYI